MPSVAEAWKLKVSAAFGWNAPSIDILHSAKLLYACCIQQLSLHNETMHATGPQPNLWDRRCPPNYRGHLHETHGCPRSATAILHQSKGINFIPPPSLETIKTRGHKKWRTLVLKFHTLGCPRFGFIIITVKILLNCGQSLSHNSDIQIIISLHFHTSLPYTLKLREIFVT